MTEIAFESGATVKKGDLLVKLDTSSEEAQLRAAAAQVQLAKLNADRTANLRADNTVSQSELDTAEATLQQNQANADAIRATIDKKTIRAPFAGQARHPAGEPRRISWTWARPSCRCKSLDPVFVDFSLPQQDLSRLETGLVVQVSSDAYPGREI